MAGEGAETKRSVPWLGRRSELLFQFGLVIFGAVLALGFDQWRESRREAARADMAVASIRSELLINRQEVARAQQYHQALAERFEELRDRGAERPGWDDFPQGLLSPARVVSTAWQSALTTGVENRIPYSQVLVLAHVYETQSSYANLSDQLTATAYQDLMHFGPEALLERYRNFIPVQRDFSGKESELLSAYDKALADLGP